MDKSSRHFAEPKTSRGTWKTTRPPTTDGPTTKPGPFTFGSPINRLHTINGRVELGRFSATNLETRMTPPVQRPSWPRKSAKPSRTNARSQQQALHPI